MMYKRQMHEEVQQKPCAISLKTTCALSWLWDGLSLEVDPDTTSLRDPRAGLCFSPIAKGERIISNK